MQRVVDGRGGGLRTWVIFAVACSIVGWTVFSSALSLPFLADDYGELAKALGGPAAWFSGADTVFVRPVFWASLWMDHGVWGLEPQGYHATNVWLHIANSVLVAAVLHMLLGRLRPRRANPRFVAMLAGGIFLILPSHGEPIYWISARADLLVTLFCLLSLMALVKDADHERQGAWQVASVGCFALALLSKEAGVTFPLVLTAAAAALGPRGSPIRRRAVVAVRRTASHFTVLIAYLGYRWWQVGSPIGGYGAESYLGSGPVRLVGKAALAIWRSFAPLPSPRWVVVAVGVAILVAALTVIRAGRADSWRSSPTVALGVAAAGSLVVAVAPVVNLAPTNMTTRMVYLPSVFAVAIIAVGVDLTWRRTRWSALLWSFVLVGALIFNAHEAARWRAAGSAAEAAAAVVADLEGDDDTYLLNVPDTVAGVIAFRNSAGSIGRVVQRDHTGQALVVTAVAFASPSDTSSIEVLSEDPLTVQVESTSANLDRPTLHADEGRWSVGATDRHRYHVTFGKGIRPDQILVHSRGTLRGLEHSE